MAPCRLFIFCQILHSLECGTMCESKDARNVGDVEQLLKDTIQVRINAADGMLEIMLLDPKGQHASDEKWIEVAEEECIHKFPFVFLRDNCICAGCFHLDSSSRLTSFIKLDVEDAIVEAVVCYANVRNVRLGRHLHSNLDSPSDASLVIRCCWQSGHTSEFPIHWLMERRFTKRGRLQRLQEMDLSTLHQEFFGIADTSVPVHKRVPYFDLDGVRGFSSQEMLQWCLTLERYGVCVVRTDNSEQILKRFTNQFGFREWSSFGEFFLVESKPTAVNLSYTAFPLQLHSDLPHYHEPPQVQFLHCIAQTECEGGASLLVDAVHVAEFMREHHPQEFKLLCEIEMEYKDYHTEVLYDCGVGGKSSTPHAPIWGPERDMKWFMRYKHAIISLDHSDTTTLDPLKKRILQINYSDHHRDSILTDVSDPEQVKAYYKACKLMATLLNDDANVHKVKLSPGDILCFDNRRILHGRTGFSLAEGGTRTLLGTYVRWMKLLHEASQSKRAIPQTLDLIDCSVLYYSVHFSRSFWGLLFLPAFYCMQP